MAVLPEAADGGEGTLSPPSLREGSMQCGAEVVLARGRDSSPHPPCWGDLCMPSEGAPSGGLQAGDVQPPAPQTACRPL